MKRIFDILFGIVGIFLLSPILLVFIFLVWKQDFYSPFYISSRIGKDHNNFNFIKLRSMVVNADSTGVDSTSANDRRITTTGSVIRKYKIDEIPQILHVLSGKMSFVGPRPNVSSDVDLYTTEEMKLLSVRPGITDISSIVFSDEGDILSGSDDPDLKYNQVIRPWKSRLGLLYIDNAGIILDIVLIFITILAIISKKSALKLINKLLVVLGAEEALVKVCKREVELVPYPPPGSHEIVLKR